MTAKRNSTFKQTLVPSVARANQSCVIEQAPFFLLSRQAGKFLVKRIIGRNESLLAMQDRRVRRSRIIPVADIQALQISLHARTQRGMRVGVEVRVMQVGNLRLVGAEFDDRRFFEATPHLSGEANKVIVVLDLNTIQVSIHASVLRQ